ncbi:OmpA family protein [Acidimangrovimonas sediminis]|uniref:OmpA family protein n=1 Tax=Acidimangrovimonas sediminis TaxID=2056283 RepID=UPI000C805565|nr:OmpA family protein [Acidimangrovimonas sediminis]
MRVSQNLLALAAFAIAAVLCYAGAVWGVGVVETRSTEMVHQRLSQAGLDWVTVTPDGLQLHLGGKAPDEAARFRAISVASSQVDPNRIQDDMSVTPPKAIQAPRFSVELLRNENGISLIGLVPASTGHDPILDKVDPVMGKDRVTDMLETADYPAPDEWSDALSFGLEALAKLPRSKISISSDRVSVTAISESLAAKRRMEAELAQMAPKGLKLSLDISAPRPVITPFTLRFVIDDSGPRFDACSADTDDARARIVAAGRKAGVEGKISCTVGLGVPSPQWAEAAVEGIDAVKTLGHASVTFSDADVTLLAEASVGQANFDRVVGDLQARLPDVFSLKATLAEKKAQKKGPAEFTATLSASGQVQMRGRIGSALTRDAITSYARAAFPDAGVYNATRIDKELPDGWPVRVLAGLRALSFLDHGALLVRNDTVNVSGVSGHKDASDQISRVLSDKLGQGKAFKISVQYDKKLDPLAGLPSPQECVDGANAILKKHQITFDPGSDRLDAAAAKVMDDLADELKQCTRVPMEIGGYTDNQGRAEMNLALSQKRAQAVVNGLLSRRVPVANFHAKGYGEADPIADNSTEAGREANRRIEFSLIDAGGAKKSGQTGDTSGDAAAANAEGGNAAAGDAGGGDTAGPDAQGGDQGADQATGDTDGQGADQVAPDNLPDGSGDDGADVAGPAQAGDKGSADQGAADQGSGDQTSGDQAGAQVGAQDGGSVPSAEPGTTDQAPKKPTVRPKLRPAK